MMVGPEGRTVGVEHIAELVDFSINNIKNSAASSFLKEGSLSVHIAGVNGREGWPDLAPYDAIHVGAAAPEIPQPLIDQLKPGGRLVIPVGTVFQDLQVIDKKTDGSVSIRSETSVRYVPLTSKAAQTELHFGVVFCSSFYFNYAGNEMAKATLLKFSSRRMVVFPGIVLGSSCTPPISIG
ncbi:hypothetical protein BHE74_00046050 [Ensete ventricosum]|nr:hypothetical protein BHE74_00046050 [Ensete ventricosum]